MFHDISSGFEHCLDNRHAEPTNSAGTVKLAKEMNEHVTQKRKLQKKTVFPELGKADLQSSATHLSNAIRHVLSMPILSNDPRWLISSSTHLCPAAPPPPTPHSPLAEPAVPGAVSGKTGLVCLKYPKRDLY